MLRSGNLMKKRILYYNKEHFDNVVYLRIMSFQMHRGSNRSKPSFTPERTTKLKLSVSSTRRQGPKSLGLRMANHYPKIRVSSVNEETDISCCCLELRAPPSAHTPAKPPTSSELMRERLKFPVLSDLIYFESCYPSAFYRSLLQL